MPIIIMAADEALTVENLSKKFESLSKDFFAESNKETVRQK